MKKTIFLLLLPFVTLYSFAQQGEHKIEKILSFSTDDSDNLFILNNINGSIEVEKTAGSDIQLLAYKTIKAANQKIYNQGVEEVKIGIIEKGKTILVYMESPCSSINPANISEKQIRQGAYNSWGNNQSCKWRPKYDYILNYHLKIPETINIKVSTVNEGNIKIKNLSSDISANNVNGSIQIDQAAGKIEVHTINGNVDINYLSNPVKSSKYYTLNGDINVYFRDQLSADVYFKSFNGKLYTDINDIYPMQPVIEKQTNENEAGIKIKVGSKKGLKIGRGGPELAFETFNGDTYLYQK